MSWLSLESGLFFVVALACASVALADEHVLPVPGDVAELQQATQGIRGLETFGKNGYLGIECGYQPLLLGSRLPIAPAAHVPWAKPYARGQIKLLIITTFGNSSADVAELVQVARELDADVRWLLVAEMAVSGASGTDEGYRTVFLPEQARALLREDYDAIVVTFGTNTPRYGSARAHPYLPDDVVHSILNKVARGTGLVLPGQFSSGYWADETPLAAALPARMTPEFFTLDAAHSRVTAGPDGALFRGLDYTATRFLSSTPLVVYDWKLRADTKVLAAIDGKPVALMRQHGQGRILQLGWDGTLGPRRYAGRAPLEHSTALSVRAITYAAHKEPEVQLELRTLRARAGEASVIEAQLTQPARIEITVRDDTFRVLHVVTAQLRAGSNTLQLPRLPNGEYFLQAIARDAHRKVLTWGDLRLTVEASAQLTVETDKQSYRADETVHITARCTGACANTARFSVRDATGRLLLQATRPYTPDITFDYQMVAPRVAPHKVMVELLDADGPVLQATAQFFVPNSRWDDYENVLWPYSRVLPTHSLLRDEAGITALLDGSGHEEVSSFAAHYGQRAARLNDGMLSPALVQTQPLTAAAPVATLPASLAAAQRYGALFWLFQNERHQMTDAGAPDAEGLARFRSYLRARYAKLPALNAAWGTRYVHWDQIQPTLTDAVSGGVKNLAPWVDFRLYVADQAFQIDAARAQAIRAEVGPDAVVGLDGVTTSAHMLPYGATDFGRLTSEGALNFYAPYMDELLIASLVTGPKVRYMGSSMSRADYFGLPWRDAFRGYSGSVRFFGPTLTTDFGYLLPAGRWTGESTRELREGIGKLLIGSERELSPVVILYNYPSLITNSGAKYWEERHGGESASWFAAESRSAIEQLLLAAGVSFGYQTDAQVARGALAGKRLLIIPRQMGLALSDATARAIERFVREGGTVLADLTPGLCDEHGKPRASPALDGLFGVQSSGETMVRVEHGLWARVAPSSSARALLHEGARLPDEWYDRRLRVTDGRALGAHSADKAPAFIVKQTGKGRSLLLNTLLLPKATAAALQVKDWDLAEQQLLMRALLEAAGVALHARVASTSGEPETHVEVNRFRDGANAYFGFYAHAAPRAPAEQVLARFDDAKETYDVRQGKYLGRVAEVPLPLSAQQAALFARLDYTLRALELTPPPSAARGALLQIEIALQATAEPARHVVHVELRGPNGVPLPLYSQNVVLERGRGQLQLMTALNDPKGTWQIHAREVVSGLEASARVELR